MGGHRPRGQLVRRIINRLLHEVSGQDLTEYALLLVLVALAVMMTLSGFSRAVANLFGGEAETVECHAKPQSERARACEEILGKRAPQGK